MLRFCLPVDLIVNDKAGFVWLVNFGHSLIKLKVWEGEVKGWEGWMWTLVSIW